MPITPQSCYQASPHVLLQEVAGEAVLLNLDSETYFGLDAVGLRMWQLVSQGSPLQTALDTLLLEYEAPSQTLQRDIFALVQSLLDHHLLIPLD